MWAYHLLAHALALLGSPALLLAALFSKKVRAGLAERLGFLSTVPPCLPGRRRVWLHCASVGEVQTARRLIERLLADPRVDLVLSTITPTGRALARRHFGARCPVFLWPIDLSIVVARAMRLVRPDALVLLETELWPAVLDAARRRRLPVVVLNARISDRTLVRYRRLRFFFAPLLRAVSLFAAQSEEHARRLASIGVDRARIAVPGNLKFDLSLGPETARDEPSFLDGRFPAGAPVLLAASTHEGEDAPVVRAFLAARAAAPELRLVLAPRHPERTRAVVALARGEGVTTVLRTELGEGAIDADGIVVDTIGELAPAMARATVVFVGGSLVPIGGHNVLEPAALGVPVVVGPHMANFRDARDALLAAGGGIEVAGEAELARTLAALLSDPARRESLARGARAAVATNAGATDRALALLFAWLFREG